MKPLYFAIQHNALLSHTTRNCQNIFSQPPICIARRGNTPIFRQSPIIKKLNDELKGKNAGNRVDFSGDNAVDYCSFVGFRADEPRRVAKMFERNRSDIDGDSVVSRLLGDGKAVFACAVSLPSTMYRRSFLAKNEKRTAVAQKVDYSKSGYLDSSQLSPKFRPMIVKVDGDYAGAVGDTDGLDGEIWENQKVDFPDGAILAFCEWMDFRSNAGSLLVLEKDESMQEGTIQVSADEEVDIRFRVGVPASLLDAIQESSPDRKHHRISVLTHALSRGFEILNKDYREHWREFSNLRLVADILQEKGCPIWSDDDFCPETAATTLYPHVLSDALPGDDDDD